MTAPLVSIVTPTKNRLALLSEAIQSVQAQTLAAWEHIIVDDGSDDGTQQAVEDAAKKDPRLRYFRRNGEKSGANVCRNIGLANSRGEFVLFLDSDDLLRPGCLAGRVSIMERNRDLDFAAFQYDVFKTHRGDLGEKVSRDRFGDDLLRFLCFEPPWIITGPVWRKSALHRIGAFDEALPSWQDVDLHIRAVAGGLRYLSLAEIDHDIRWQFEETKVSVEQRRSMRHLEAAIPMFAKFEAVVRAGPGMNWNRQRALGGLYFLVAEMMLDAGVRKAAMRCWAQARQRGLTGKFLYWQGAALLRLRSLGGAGQSFGTRLAHKWKGMVRFRTVPERVG